MKKILLFIVVATTLSSCKALRGTESFTEAQSYGKCCEHPTYVATIGKEAGVLNGARTSSGLRLAVLLKDAQEKFGADVTISNVRWDLQNGSRKSVVYDVVRCK